MKRINRKKHHLSKTAFIFLLPAVFFIVMYNLVPFIWNFILSFQKWNGFSAPTFQGFANFTKIIKTGNFKIGLKNSVIYAFSSTIGCVVLGLLQATLLFRIRGREGKLYSLILYMPPMLPAAVVGVMFVFFFNATIGPLNNFLKLIGFDNWTHIWLQEKGTAMPSLIFVAIWKSTGSVMVLCYAAMQSIPDSLYESSKLDGAKFWTQMTRITYPLIRPTIMLASINTLGGQYKSYNLIFTMTQGGPGTLTTTVPIVMKKTAFSFGSFGEAAAEGVIFTMVVAMSILLVRRSMKGEDYEY